MNAPRFTRNPDPIKLKDAFPLLPGETFEQYVARNMAMLCRSEGHFGRLPSNNINETSEKAAAAVAARFAANGHPTDIRTAQILDMMADGPPRTVVEIRNAIGWHIDTIKRTVQDMVRNGALKTLPDRVNGCKAYTLGDEQ